MNRRAVGQVVLVLMLLTSALPPASANHLPGVDPSTDSILETTLDLVGDARENVDAVRDDVESAVSDTRYEVNATTNLTVTVLEEDAESVGDAWQGATLPGDTLPDVPSVWHVTTHRAYEGKRSYWFGFEEEATYTTGLDRALLSEPIDLRGMIGTDRGTEAARTAYDAGYNATADQYPTAADAANAAAASVGDGRLSDSPPLPERTNATAGVGLITLAFHHLYDLSFNTNDDGLYNDGVRVEARAMRPDGTWNNADWEPLYPTAAHESSVAASEDPYRSPFETQPEGVSTVAPIVEGPLSNLQVDGGFLCPNGEFTINLDSITITPGAGGQFLCDLPVPATRTGDVDLDDPHGSMPFHADDAAWSLAPEEYNGRALGLGWAFVGSSDTDGDREADWVRSHFNLTNYAGEIVQVRFHASTSGSKRAVGQGWFVDNVTIRGEAYHHDVGVVEVPALTRAVERVAPGTAIPMEAVVKNFGARNQSHVILNATACPADAGPCDAGSGTAAYHASADVGFLASQEERTVTLPPFRTPESPERFNLTFEAVIPQRAPDGGNVTVATASQAARVDENPLNDQAPRAITVISETVHDLVLANATVAPPQSGIDERKHVQLRLENRGNVDEGVTVDISVRRLHRETGRTVSWTPVAHDAATVPYGRTLTSLGAEDGNLTLNLTWSPPAPGLYEFHFNVTGAGIALQERFPTFVKASPSAYLRDDFETLDLPTPNDEVLGAAGQWSADLRPWRPAPYHGSTVWAPDLDDHHPSAAVEGGLFKSIFKALFALPSPLGRFIEDRCEFQLPNICHPDRDSSLDQNTGAANGGQPTDGVRTDYYLARTVDLREWANLERGEVEFVFHQASTMNWLDAVRNGEDTSDRTNITRGTVIVYPHNSSYQWENTFLHGGNSTVLTAEAEARNQSLPLMAATGQPVAEYDTPFPWRQDAVDLTQWKGEVVTVIFHYEIPPGRAHTAFGGSNLPPSTFTSGLANVKERWLVDDVRVTVRGVETARDSMEGVTMAPQWSALGWATRDFPVQYAALWHAETGEGNPSHEDEPFQRALWWGVAAQNPTNPNEFCQGYIKDRYSVVASPVIDLRRSLQPVLRFDHRYTFDADKRVGDLYLDGGNVRVSVLQPDGTWGEPVILGNASVYTGGIYDGEDLFGHAAPAFVAANDQDSDGKGDWQRVALDLSQFRGHRVRLEFHAVSRSSQHNQLADAPERSPCSSEGLKGWSGWFVDNVRVQEERFARDLTVDALVSPAPPAAGQWLLGPGVRQPMAVDVRNVGVFTAEEASVTVGVYPVENGVVNRSAPLYRHTAVMPAKDPVTGEALSLEPNATYRFNLPPWTPPAEEGAEVVIEAEARLLRDGQPVRDEDATNDVLSRRVALVAVHDVALTRLDVTPLRAAAEPRTITARVENLGNMDERHLADADDFEVRVSIVDAQGRVTELGSKPVGELAPGQAWTPSQPWTWRPEDPLDYVVRAEVVVPGDRDPENNALTQPVTVLTTRLQDDFENDAGALTGLGAWSLEAGNAATGERAWAFGGPSGYPANASDALTTWGSDPVDLRDARSAILAFQHQYHFEEGYDAGVVEACADACGSAANWQPLRPEAGYQKLTTASPLVDDANAWANDPDAGVGFTGREDDWTRAVVDLGRQDFLTERLRIFNETFAGGPPQERGAWSAWNFTLTPHSPGYMWHSSADVSLVPTLYKVDHFESELALRDVAFDGITPDRYGRNAFLTFWDWRNLGTSGIGQHSTIAVDILTPDGRIIHETAVRHAPYANNYRGWTPNVIPIDLQKVKDSGADRITIRFAHHIQDADEKLHSMHMGWAIDDVRIYAIDASGHRNTIYPEAAAVDDLSYPGENATEAHRNATRNDTGGPYWSHTLATHYRNGTVVTEPAGWNLTDRVSHGGWEPVRSGPGHIWRFGGTGEPGSAYSRLITPLDLTAATDSATLAVRHDYDFQTLKILGETVALAGGVVQVATAEPDANGGGVQWITLRPDLTRSNGPAPVRAAGHSHSPFGADPESDSPFGPVDHTSPRVFAGDAGGVLTDHFDLSAFRGQRVWLSFTAWSTCPAYENRFLDADNHDRDNALCTKKNDNTESQSWEIHGVAVDADVLQAERLHLRFRGATDANNQAAGWRVDNVTVLTASREYGLDLRIVEPQPGTRVAPGTNHTVELAVRNTGQRAVTARVDLEIALPDEDGSRAVYAGDIRLAPGETAHVSSLDDAPLEWTVPPNATHGERVAISASVNLTDDFEGRWEQVLADNRRQAAVEVTTKDLANVTRVSVEPNDVSIGDAGAEVRVVARITNDSPFPRSLEDANLTLVNEEGAAVLTLPLGFADVDDFDLPPFGATNATWQLRLSKSLPEGNYTVRVRAAHEAGGSHQDAPLFVAHGNATFFSRAGFHPPHTEDMASSGAWFRSTRFYYNHTTYYDADDPKTRDGWYMSVTGSRGTQGEYALTTPWINASQLDAAWLSFRHRYVMSPGDAGSAGAVLEIRDILRGDEDAPSEWRAIAPQGGYPGTMRTAVAGGGTGAQNGVETGGASSTAYNPMVARLCEARDPPETPPCQHPGWVGQSHNYAVSPLRPEAWELATFNLTSALNLTGPNETERFQIRFVAGITALNSHEATWAVDYVTVSPHRVEVGPRQAYTLQDGVDKTFRFTIHNPGNLTDHAEVRVAPGTLPPSWDLTITLDDGTRLTDATGAPITNVTLPPGASKGVLVRVMTPIERTFDSEREVTITTRSLKDPGKVHAEVLSLDFQPRTWPDLAVDADGVRIASEALEAGRKVPVHVRVRNVGDTLVRDVVLEAIDQPEVGDPIPLTSAAGTPTVTIPSLAAGEETVVTLQWTPRADGNHTIRVVADAPGVITEYDEANNVATQRAVVGAENLPDLRVEAELLRGDGAPLDGAISAGEALVVRARIENHGTGPAAGVQVSMLADAFSLLPERPYVLNGTIPPGEARVVEGRWRAEIPDTYLLHVEAFSDWTIAPERTGARITGDSNYTDDNFWRSRLVVRSPGLTLAPTYPEDALHGGDRAALNLTVANRGNTADAYRVSLEPPAGWTAAFHETGTRHAVLSLASGANATLVYFVTAPDDATAGAHALRIHGRSHNTSEAPEVTVPLTVAREGALRVSATDLTTPPMEVPLHVTLDNGVNAGSRVVLNASLPDGWRARGTGALTLAPFQTRNVTLHLDVPHGTPAGEYEVTLRVAGDANATVAVPVEVVPHREVAIAPDVGDDLPVQRGLERNVPFTVENRGNLPLSLDLAAHAGEAVEAWVEPAFVEVPPGASARATLRVKALEVADNATLTLVAQGAEGAEARHTMRLHEVAIDLSVGDLTWEPRFNIQAGTTMTFNTLLANAGELTMERVPTALFVDGHLVAYQEVADLTADETRDVTFQWTAEAGAHDVWVVADPYEELGERDESNNAVVETVTVNSGGPGFLRIFQEDGAVGDALETPGLGLAALLAALAVTALAARKVRGRDR